MQSTQEGSLNGERYPIADEIPQEQLDQEAAQLDALESKSMLGRLFGYARMGGPGFMAAAATLGAGSLTAAMLAGSQFGYKTLWISWVAMGSGLFMLAAVARFTTKGNFNLIQTQAHHHGWFMARVLTAFIGLVTVAIAFNFGQVALGSHLIEALAAQAGVDFPQKFNWPLYGILVAWLALRYGRGGTGVAIVESVMKYALLLMVVCFGLSLAVVGIDWPAALKGFFVPWLPGGKAGIDLFIASSAAAIGVADWVFYHYAGHAKGWGPKHEGLARTDIVMGLALPFIAVNFIVVSVFAATIYGSADIPSTAIELSAALVPLLGEQGAALAFMIGFLAVPITSSVVLCIICAIGVFEMMKWKPDVRSMRWKICLMLPQIGLLGAFLPSPILLIIIIAAALSLTNLRSA